MAFINPSKLIIGLTGAGVIGGAGAGIYYLNNSKEKLASQQQENKVSKKLSKFGYLVLKTEGDEDNDKWQIVLNEYIKVKTESGLHNFADETLNGLKKECKKILDSENNYPFAKRFCVMGETMDAMLKRNNYAKLGANTEEADKAKWKRKIDAIKENAVAINEMGLELKNDDYDSALLIASCEKIKTSDDKNWCYWGKEEK